MTSLNQAMIFAAGLGTRLKPYTDQKPKALIEIDGVPMLERIILKMKSIGIQHIVINLHHFPEQIVSFLKSKNFFDLQILFSYETESLLETGGGLKKAAPLFNHSEPVLVHNVDVLSTLDFSKMLDYHLKNKALATLFVQKRKSTRYFLFDKEFHLSGWENTITGEEIKTANAPESIEALSFCGIHILNPAIFNLITEAGKFSVVPLYLRLASKYPVFGYRDDNVSYLDIGKPESLEKAGKYFPAL